MPIFDVRHQGRAHRILQRALAGDRLPHAYIFHGADGIGKEMLALHLAKLLLCENPIDAKPGTGEEYSDWSGPARDACGACQACHLVDVGNHPDLHLVYRQLNAHHPDPTVRKRKAIDLGVDVVRHFVIDAVGVTPACGRAKVFVIREADRITPPAQNALLKTLEEPPKTTFLILLARSLDRLLATTRSRCQPVGFSPLPQSFVADRLRCVADGVAPEDADLYAALAQGSLGGALGYAADGVAVFNRELCDALVALEPAGASAVAKRIVEYAKESSAKYRERDAALSDTAAQRLALRTVFVLLAAWHGDVMRVIAGSESCLANTASVSSLRKAANRFTLDSSARAVTLIAQAEKQLSLNVNVQLCIESLMFKLADPSAKMRAASA